MNSSEVKSDPGEQLLQPVGNTERYDFIDVLRGFALLGILMPNIQAFSMIASSYTNPTAFGDLTGSNFAVWYATQLLFEQKFMTIFSVLFGAGILIMTQRAEARGRRALGLHYRRMGWLLLFGLVHAHFLWYGDILFCYAICGMFVYWLRRLGPKWLLVIGLLLVSVGSATFLGFQSLIDMAPQDQLDGMKQQWQPPQDAVDKEVAAYRGNWIDAAPYRSTMAAIIEFFLMPFYFFWRASGLMLIGMALYKWKVITGERSTRFYLIGAIVGFGIGLPVVVYGIQQNVAYDFQMSYSQFQGQQLNYWAAPLVSFAYMSVIAIVCQKKWLGLLRHSLASVGRMAFSNYIAQTVICTVIFYGSTLFFGLGLGLFGSVSRTGQMGIVFAVWLVLLIVSPIWLKFFRFGPLEWLWRSLSYWRFQPMLREQPSVDR